MALINPYILANTGGIPRLESRSVTVNSSNVIYEFLSHPFFSRPFCGLIIYKLSEIPSSATDTLPVVFSSNGKSISVTSIGGAEVTVADITGSGIYLAFYDSSTNTLQLLTGI